MPPNVMIQPRSKWGFASPNKGLVQYEIKEGHKQQLLQEAASLLPDYAKLSDELLKNKLHHVDSTRVKNKLDSYTQAYMDKYSQNPFFSFSREGRNLAKEMQGVVKDPMLTALTQQYEKDVQRWDQADKDGVSTEYDVNEQGIRVLNTATGRVERKFNLDSKTDRPLTIDESYHYINNVVGGASGGFNYEMSSAKDLDSTIEKAFSNIGNDHTERDILAEGKKIVEGGNVRQVDTRIKWLLNQGLSQGNLNRIYAEYTKKAGKFDINEAKKYALHYVNNYAESKKDHVSNISYIDDIKKEAAGYGGVSDKQIPLNTYYNSVMLASDGQKELHLKSPGGSISVGVGNIITNDVFKNAPKSYTKDGVEYKSHRVTDLDIFRSILPQGMFIQAEASNEEKNIRAGEFTQAPQAAYKNMTISQLEAPSNQIMVKDNRGRPAGPDDLLRLSKIFGVTSDQLSNKEFKPTSKTPVPENLKKYFSINSNGVPELQRSYFIHGVGITPKRRGGILGFVTNDDKEASDYFTSLGRNSIDDDGTRQEYNEYSGKKDELSTSGLNDQNYRVDVFIPMNNSEILMGAQARGTQDAFLINDFSRMSNLNIPVDKGYLGLAPFNQVSDPNKYMSYPNQ